MKIDFTPSQVVLDLLLVDTFDRISMESTAAVIVKVLALNGDTWRGATGQELSEGFHLLTKYEGKWRDRFNNPFVKVNTHGLVEAGYAEWENDTTIKFTDKGLERLAKWVELGE